MVFNCKICGGGLDVVNANKIVTCPYCGIQQTLPKTENDKIINLYDRANHFLRKNDYDKAEAIYETILNEDSTDAEAYWSLVLCKYGVEYVEDQKTGKYIPTCNRTRTQSILADEDYKKALDNSTKEQGELYQKQAEEINEIQKRILELSNKESPYDVFICYKEKDNNGNRTEDSVLAQDIFDKLVGEGLRVFFARITLEDKLGVDYEPYIYAALNSSKVMIVLGTNKEYFEAPWVKNEWSRYLALTKTNRDKILIPCYKGMDAYDLPEEFAHLQAQDMDKIGFLQDLVRGVKKVTNVGVEFGDTKKPQGLSIAQKEEIYEKTIKDIKTTETTTVLGHAEKAKIYKELEQNLRRIGEYKDSKKLAEKCNELSKSEKSIIKKTLIKTTSIVAIVAIVFGFLITQLYIKPKEKEAEILDTYNSAMNNYETNEYLKAIRAFAKLGNYKDCESKIEEAKDKWRRSNSRVMANTTFNTYAVKKIGSITGIGESDVSQIAGYGEYILILKNDGTVHSYSTDDVDRSEYTKDWKDIVSIAISPDIVYGLKKDGTVEYSKYVSNSDSNVNVENWTNIVQIEPCLHGGVVGLKDDGTIVYSGVDRRCILDLKEWSDIVQLSGSNTLLVGLKIDGTIVCTYTAAYTNINMEDESDVIQLSTNNYDSNNVALIRKDGSVVAYGDNSSGQCYVDDWNNIDIVYLYTEPGCIYGISRDGSINYVGYIYGYDDPSYWSGIKTDEEWRSMK